jgi:hypothetical protein
METGVICLLLEVKEKEKEEAAVSTARQRASPRDATTAMAVLAVAVLPRLQAQTAKAVRVSLWSGQVEEVEVVGGVRALGTAKAALEEGGMGATATKTMATATTMMAMPAITAVEGKHTTMAAPQAAEATIQPSLLAVRDAAFQGLKTTTAPSSEISLGSNAQRSFFEADMTQNKKFSN